MKHSGAMVKQLLVRAAWVFVPIMLLYALAQFNTTPGAQTPGSKRLRVALFINGTLGDKSFFDSAARGLAQAHAALPITARVVEGSTDPTRWEGALTDLADSGDYDMVIAGTFTMTPYIEKLAPRYPEVHFLVYDASVDYGACTCGNVYSILFRQNEGAYLAGNLAARLAQAGLPGMAPGAGLGIVGGMQFPVIEDFIIGFRAGAHAAEPGINIQAQYANSFSDPAAGKEIAKQQYAHHAGIIFHAAGASGQGVNEAAAEAGAYVIGTDMDQYALYHTSHPELASRIVTSVVKDVDVGIYRAISHHLQGDLPYGSAQSIGLAEGGISLVQDTAVMRQAPQVVLDAVAQVKADIVAHRLQVPGAFNKHEFNKHEFGKHGN